MIHAPSDHERGEHLRNEFLLLRGDVRIQRQGEDAIRGSFRHREVTPCVPEVSIGASQMNGRGVMHARSNTRRIQLRENAVPLVDLHHEEMPDVRVASDPASADAVPATSASNSK